jgi:hypothetical protein
MRRSPLTTLKAPVALLGGGLALLIAAVPPTGAGPAPEPPAAPDEAGGQRDGDPSRIIRLHVGIPDRVFIGQQRDLLLRSFPDAETVPFAGQSDAFTVRAKTAGLSCVLAGATPDELRVASIGFNLDGTYEGIAEGVWRTAEGIAKGSTVNDLLGTYGQPSEIVDKGARRRAGTSPDPNLPKLYQYRNEDRTITTSFVVQQNRVVRIVLNHLEPLERHLLRRSPTAPAPGPGGTAPDPGPPPAPSPQDPPPRDPAAPPS